jgi:cysteine-rich repeat protein
MIGEATVSPLTRASAVALLVALTRSPPARATVATDLCPSGADPCEINTAITVDPGSVIDLTGRALQLDAAGRITLGAGAVQILAGSVRLLPGARITGATGAAASSLEIDTTGDIVLQASGSTLSRIDLSASPVAGGAITLKAGGAITVAGNITSDGPSTEATGGNISLISAAGDLVVSGTLSSSGGSDGSGGFITIEADGGKIDLVQPVDISGGEFGAGELSVMASGDVIVRQGINASGGGLSGDGGTVFISAGGTATLLGNIDGTAAGSTAEGGGTGGDVEIDANQDVVVSGQVDCTSGFPDGDAGTFSSTAGGNFTQTQKITLLGNGVDACGGEMDVSAGRDITLVQIEASGGSCGGGDISAQGLGTLTAGASIHADGGGGDGGGDAGTIDIEGRDVVTNDVVRANAGTSANFIGQITLVGCNVTVNKSSEIRTLGGLGGAEPDFGNLIQASGKATVLGNLLTTPSSTNTIVSRDATMSPAISGTVTPPAVETLDPTLPPCPAPTAACGDGSLDPGEQCDDGNTVSCDGCNASCQVEACGNGKVECAEECDAGPLNGQPGSGCDAQCNVVPLPGGFLLFSGGQTRNSCMAEWRIKLANGQVSGGFPLRTQSCIDGDPACDDDGQADGNCTFDVEVCADEIDARLPKCNPIQIASISIVKPNPLTASHAIDLANAQALVSAIEPLGLTVKAGTTVLVPGTPITERNDCTTGFHLVVPHPAGVAGSKTFNLGAHDGLGARMTSNQVTLTCTPDTAVCGNGTVELGEQCDDGNHVACDGCAPTCRLERCGDGIAECGEECDDGPSNGTPGSKCSSACTEVVPALRIPGGGSRRSDCLLETSIDMQSPTLKGDGTPAGKQVCVDNDPSCDFDPTPGSCQFHAWLCFGAGDARIACAADAVASIAVQKPSVKDQGGLAALRQALLQRLGAFTLPLPAGEHCTQRMNVEATAGKTTKLSLKVSDPLGARDSDSLQFKCEAAAR